MEATAATKMAATEMAVEVMVTVIAGVGAATSSAPGFESIHS
jgi:hypothetical protein